jgi:large subunit ribosomal protein L4e
VQASVFDLEGNNVGSTELPAIFDTPINSKLINRVFWALFTHSVQPQGRSPVAGERTSAQSWNTGHGVARMARVKGERNPRSGQAAGVAGVVKGRLAHPPKAEKVVWKRVNRKERLIALKSAVAATASSQAVAARGHVLAKVPSVPLVVDDKLQGLARAADLRAFFEKLGLTPDIQRSAKRKQRSGKASWRGRSRRNGRGPLLVVSEDKGLGKAAGSFPGVEVVKVDDLSIIPLAPGGNAGRLTVWTRSSLAALSKRFEEVVLNAA